MPNLESLITNWILRALGVRKFLEDVAAGREAIRAWA